MTIRPRGVWHEGLQMSGFIKVGDQQGPRGQSRREVEQLIFLNSSSSGMTARGGLNFSPHTVARAIAAAREKASCSSSLLGWPVAASVLL